MASALRFALRNFIKCQSNHRIVSLSRRCIHSIDAPIDGGSATTITILNEEQDQGIFVDAYSDVGFRLNNGIRVMGPCAVFPRSVLHWSVRGVDDINEDSLSLFTMLEPKLDILVLGIGESENMARLNTNLIKYVRSKKLNLEILPTAQALATFNFLNSERRFCAGAFIPPSYLAESRYEEDMQFESMVNAGQDIYKIPDMMDSYESTTKGRKGELWAMEEKDGDKKDG